MAPGARFTDRNGTTFAFDDVPASVTTLPFAETARTLPVWLSHFSPVGLKWSTAISNCAQSRSEFAMKILRDASTPAKKML
jgi:hypothetical protein